MLQREIRHEGLKVQRVVKAEAREILDILAEMQIQAWNGRWARHEARQTKLRDRFLSAITIHTTQEATIDTDKLKTIAEDRTREYEESIDALDHLLGDSLELDHSVNWNFLVSELRREEKAFEAQDVPAPHEPDAGDEEFRPQISPLAQMIPSLRKRETEKAAHRFVAAKQKWSELAAITERCRKESAERDARRRESLAAIEQWKEAYLTCEAKSVPDYCRLVLAASKYPDSFPQDVDVDYVAGSRTLVVDYTLPCISALPTVKELRLIVSRGDLKEVKVSDAWRGRTYDPVLYQIALRSLYELFQADQANAIDSIVFNGWVNSIDKATGKEVSGCMLTVHARKREFMEMNLAKVDPAACFKKLKGISAARLTALQPVRPILQLNREDSRFVPGHRVVDVLDDSSNLAAMDWEDFEHLIRELFEKEFSTSGGEVKITQASRDGGVDAIVFDPDPIRGGRIVIQAKRYTSTVSVSAVRDLFGTVHNEGANKGILVTTADYGPDAYDFAKGKPLTLISGSELLYLLAKHGHKARIDLKEARMLASAQKRFRFSRA
jgi:restriction system protein